jgi:hypothetical protein
VRTLLALRAAITSTAPRTATAGAPTGVCENATAVATNTTGFTAGAERRRINAAGGETPPAVARLRSRSRRCAASSARRSKLTSDARQTRPGDNPSDDLLRGPGVRDGRLAA